MSEQRDSRYGGDGGRGRQAGIKAGRAASCLTSPEEKR